MVEPLVERGCCTLVDMLSGPLKVYFGELSAGSNSSKKEKSLRAHKTHSCIRYVVSANEWVRLGMTEHVQSRRQMKPWPDPTVLLLT